MYSSSPTPKKVVYFGNMNRNEQDDFSCTMKKYTKIGDKCLYFRVMLNLALKISNWDLELEVLFYLFSINLKNINVSSFSTFENIQECYKIIKKCFYIKVFPTPRFPECCLSTYLLHERPNGLYYGFVYRSGSLSSIRNILKCHSLSHGQGE